MIDHRHAGSLGAGGRPREAWTGADGRDPGTAGCSTLAGVNFPRDLSPR
jgi:hypothetical protein